MIETQSTHDGYRRAGVAHTNAWKAWPEKQFTKAQLAELDADPRVTTREVKADAKSPAEKKAEADKQAAADKKK